MKLNVPTLMSVFLISLHSAGATPGDVDLSFDPGLGVGNTSSHVYDLQVLADGRVLLVGDFTAVDGSSRFYAARLKPDGGLDTFDPGTTLNGSAQSVIVQSDGKYVIGGFFTSVNSVTRNRIVRLNSTGSFDSSFNPGVGPNFGVYVVTLQPDGKLLIGGVFDTFNGTSRGHIARLNSDGSLDTTFNPGSGTAGGSFGIVYSIVLQPDGKILIGGEFTTYNGFARNGIARLNADGSLDNTFDPGTGVTGPVGAQVKCLALQADGKIVVGGYFTSVNGIPRNHLARLHSDGNVDATLNSGGSGPDSPVSAISLQPDGRILIGGAFNFFNGIARSGVARLHAGGALDSSYLVGNGSKDVQTIDLGSDGRAVVGGRFEMIGATTRRNIARLHSGPVITIPPASQDIQLGGNASFTYTAITASPSSAQWRFNGTDIPGASGSSYSIPVLTAARTGNYDVVVTDPYGAVTSSVAVLTVTAALGVAVTGGGRICQVPNPVPIPAGTTIRLTAIPFPGWTFNNWSPGLSTANPLDLTLTSPNNSLTAIFAPSPTACALIGNYLQSWWRGEGNGNELMNGSHAALQNGVSFATGKVGQGFSLDGVDDYLEVPYSATQDPNASSYTLEAWIKTSASGTRIIMEKYECGGFCPSGAATTLYNMYLTNGRLGAELRASGSSTIQTLVGTRVLSDGQFHHVAVIRDLDANQIRLYVDGTSEASAVLLPSSTGLLKDDDGEADSLFIGTGTVGGTSTHTSFFLGVIDEPSIYHRALSASDVAAIFAAGSLGKCLSVIPAPKSGMVAWWPGDYATDGSYFRDIINGFNGVIVNSMFILPAKVGHGFNFDGVNDLINFGPNVGNFGTGDFSVEFWVQTSSVRNQDIIGKRPICGHASFWHVAMDDVPFIEIDGDAAGTGYGGITATARVNDGQFHHVAFVRQGTSLRVYIDGLLNNSTTLGAIANINNNTSLIAGWSPCQISGTTHYFDGILDEIALYNRALSGVEIQRIYAAGSSGKWLNDFRITGMTRSLAGSTVTWDAEPFFNYRLQYKTNITDPAWLSVSGDVIAPGTTATKADSNLGTAQQRIYRVLQSP